MGNWVEGITEAVERSIQGYGVQDSWWGIGGVAESIAAIVPMSFVFLFTPTSPVGLVVQPRSSGYTQPLST